MIRGKVVLGLVTLMLTGCPDASTPPTVPAPEIHASAEYSLLTLKLTNQSAVDWKGCDIGINPHKDDPGYTAKLAALAAGATTSILMMQFADESGERFNIYTHKPKTAITHPTAISRSISTSKTNRCPAPDNMPEST